MKTINMFGRKMPIVAILMALLVVGTASATVAYFAFSGTVNVTSPFSEDVDHEFELYLTANDNGQHDITMENGATSPILVELETAISCEDGNGDPVIFNEDDIDVLYADEDGIMLSDLDGDSNQELVIPSGGTDIIVSVHTGADLTEGTYTITTLVIAPEDVDFVGLTSKNNDWEPTYEETGMHGYVIYEESSDEFDFCIKAVGLNALIDYDLIYYEDFAPDRFGMWGGAENSMVIATVYPGAYVGFDGDEVGDDVVFFNSATYIGHNLPHPNDANVDASWHDYRGAPDFYETSIGAKLWLVPEGELDITQANNGWNPDTYLFEYELVDYTCTAQP